MSLFEFSFALTSVILALALTNIVASLHRLALAGRRVRWAPEPLLLATLVFLIIVDVWLDQWTTRSMREVTVGQSLLQILKTMALFFAAASCLPEPDQIPSDGVDLFEYYDGTRFLSFGALVVGLYLFWIYRFVELGFRWIDTIVTLGVFPAIYLMLIFVRRRWLNVLVLGLIVGFYGIDLVSRQLTDVGT